MRMWEMTQEDFDALREDEKDLYTIWIDDTLKRIALAFSNGESVDLLKALEDLPGFLFIPLLSQVIGEQNIPSFRVQMIAQMSDTEILTAWDDLTYYNPKKSYLGLSMDDWAEMVYHEKSKRGL